MSDIDFQNGFLCGMATKGLSRSGNMYEPTIWNDSGIYTYFYIDFRRALEPFSLGMLTESLIVSDGVNNLTITGFEAVSTSVYKIYCNIADKINGVMVFNKKNTRLRLATGDPLPVFSVLFYVAGITTYLQLQYIYETDTFVGADFVNSETESDDLTLLSIVDTGEISESDTYAAADFVNSVTETASVVLV
jgi:hypothetical protein